MRLVVTAMARGELSTVSAALAVVYMIIYAHILCRFYLVIFVVCVSVMYAMDMAGHLDRFGGFGPTY